eukprot:SAG22_NODE_493_length_9820_cov_53.085588_7_plen_174_part_00
MPPAEGRACRREGFARGDAGSAEQQQRDAGARRPARQPAALVAAAPQPAPGPDGLVEGGATGKGGGEGGRARERARGAASGGPGCDCRCRRARKVSAANQSGRRQAPPPDAVCRPGHMPHQPGGPAHPGAVCWVGGARGSCLCAGLPVQGGGGGLPERRAPAQVRHCLPSCCH